MTFFTTISEAFLSGGVWMWVILGLQMVAIAIIIERSIFLFRKRDTTEKEFANTFKDSICKGDLKAAEALADQHMTTHPLAAVVKSGLKGAQHLGGRHEIQGRMDEILLQEQGAVETRTGFLSMLANVGTLTGLLGTIAGMIKSFAAIGYAEPAEKATLLSQGIAEAMNTTAYGLIMAIPTLIMFAVLSNRANNLTEDLHQGALKVFNWLSFYYEPVKTQDKTNRTDTAAL